jgi:hypothetical protein
MKNLDEIVKILKEEVINSKILNLEYILNQFKINPPYYLFYPYLFKDFFKINKDINRLSVAGFLYYLSLLEGDFLNDNKEIEDDLKFNKLFLLQSLTEHSIKILTTIFPLNSLFWEKWSERKKEYLQIRSLENKIKSDNFLFENYELLCDYKSSFAKIAIDSCNLLSENFSNKDKMYNSLLESQKLFSIGFQLMDDLSDIRIDIINKQFNYAVFLGKNKGLFINKNIDISNEIEDFYKSELPIEILELAYNYFDKANSLVIDFNTDSTWNKVISSKKSEVIEKKKSILTYNKVNKTLLSYKEDKLMLQFSNYETNLINSINNSINFLKTKFHNNHWEEFLTQGGISNYWATSFVGYTLKEFDNIEIKQMLSLAKTYLLNEKNVFSYNEKWKIEDLDSLNFSLLFLENSELDNQLFNKIFKFQNTDGGFSTYNNINELELAFKNESYSNFNGWCQSHQCVSALTLNFLFKYRHVYKTEWKLLLNYVIDNYEKSNINSYWWTSNIYTNYYNLIVLKELIVKKEINFNINIEIEKLKKTQNKNGSFSDSNGENIFFTAYGIKILMLNYHVNIKEIKKGVDFMLKSQFLDGSFDNSHSMRIPSPEVLKPIDKDFNNIKTYGVNCRQLEFNRIFTTSVCLSAIYTFYQYEIKN